MQASQRLGLSIEQIDEESTGLFAAERHVVRHALATAGLAALLQPLPPLAVVHVLVTPRASADEGSADEADDPWAQARAWWYLI